jgi:hypothetical protein
MTPRAGILSHLALVMEAEQRFGVALSVRDILSFRSLADWPPACARSKGRATGIPRESPCAGLLPAGSGPALVTGAGSPKLGHGF